jgi:two-component system, chemotaxis family, chemotaxis protein CheY
MKPKILIVDDAIFMRTMIRRILENSEFEVVGEASNGREAIKKAKELQPDIITMDITMPELDGIGAVREIIKLNPNIKICMVSAMGQEGMIRDAIVAGAKNFLVKPFKEEKVIATIQAMMK